MRDKRFFYSAQLWRTHKGNSKDESRRIVVFETDWLMKVKKSLQGGVGYLYKDGQNFSTDSVQFKELPMYSFHCLQHFAYDFDLFYMILSKTWNIKSLLKCKKGRKRIIFCHLNSQSPFIYISLFHWGPKKHKNVCFPRWIKQFNYLFNCNPYFPPINPLYIFSFFFYFDKFTLSNKKQVTS